MDNLAEIAILGTSGCGKTSMYMTVYKFLKKLQEQDEAQIFAVLPGGRPNFVTLSEDYISFQYAKKMHVIHATGGQDIQFIKMLRERAMELSDVYIIMIDLVRPLSYQIDFMNRHKILQKAVQGNKSTWLTLNKFDLLVNSVGSKEEALKKAEEIKTKFINHAENLGLKFEDVELTVAIEVDGYEEYNQNIVKLIGKICEKM